MCSCFLPAHPPQGLRGAGVYAESSCPLTVTDSNFTANTARAANSKGGYGGAGKPRAHCRHMGVSRRGALPGT